MPADQFHNPLGHLSLGQATAYVSKYDATLLQAVPRALNRTPIGISDSELPFFGEDEWTGYEISWLNDRGLPQVAIARFIIPATSPNLVESKSFKLYLNSFNQTKFPNWNDVKARMQVDLSACAGGNAQVELYTLKQFNEKSLQTMPGVSLDEQDISIENYDYTPELLRLDSNTGEVEETLYSDLLKSNCLITNQPDWGSVSIHYQGPKIDRASLLKYLISFRSHNEFHEQCVERIYQDLNRYCQCNQLTVCARYTRRGGLDINPIRSSLPTWNKYNRTVRQ